jgi:quinol monooxygenase YgiN
MYATIRRYRVSADAMDELLHEVDGDFAESIQQMEGFIAYECLDCGDGTLVTISTFRDREGAEASTEAAAAWVRDKISSRIAIERVEALTGEIAVSRAREALLEPTHR